MRRDQVWDERAAPRLASTGRGAVRPCRREDSRLAVGATRPSPSASGVPVLGSGAV